MKILLSFPRSGNHLVRFFIELLSEQPTYGCINNKNDIPIYRNNYENNIPFNINIFNKSNCYYKYHYIPNYKPTKLIFIIRNPNEVLLRHNNYNILTNKINNKMTMKNYDNYFDIIDYYLNCNCDKILFYYEDIIKYKKKFIYNLYNFLELNNYDKLNYVLNNIEKLYLLCACGKKRAWDGINSNFKINYYYDKITDVNFMYQFDKYINYKINNSKYYFIKEKYNLY